MLCHVCQAALEINMRHCPRCKAAVPTVATGPTQRLRSPFSRISSATTDATIARLRRAQRWQGGAAPLRYAGPWIGLNILVWAVATPLLGNIIRASSDATPSSLLYFGGFWLPVLLAVWAIAVPQALALYPWFRGAHFRGMPDMGISSALVGGALGLTTVLAQTITVAQYCCYSGTFERHIGLTLVLIVAWGIFLSPLAAPSHPRWILSTGGAWIITLTLSWWLTGQYGIFVPLGEIVNGAILGGLYSCLSLSLLPWARHGRARIS